jgi:hypothetical protein
VVGLDFAIRQLEPTVLDFNPRKLKTLSQRHRKLTIYDNKANIPKLLLNGGDENEGIGLMGFIHIQEME